MQWECTQIKFPQMSCPLQLACKSLLHRGKGRQLVRYLVSHGANLDYVDHALRNAFYWALYNHCGGTACFLLQAGTWPKPWKWVEDDALPAAISSTPGNKFDLLKCRKT